MEYLDELKNKKGIINAFSFQNDSEVKTYLTVRNLKDWHLDNIKVNPNEYTKFGREYLKRENLSDKKITYLKNVLSEDKVWKCAVIEEEKFNRDILTWDSLDFVGALENSNMNIKTSKEFEKLQLQNRRNILIVASYFLKSGSSIDDLFKIINEVGNFKLLKDEKILELIYSFTDEKIYEINENKVKINYIKLSKEPLPSNLAYAIKKDSNKNLSLVDKMSNFIIEKQKTSVKEEIKYKLEMTELDNFCKIKIKK